MDLLEFARGPAMQWALILLVLGTFWRIAGIVFLRHKRDLSEPRTTGQWSGALGTIVKRTVPAEAFRSRVIYSNLMGYTFHIGLAIVVFGYMPHILWFESIFGFQWPALPNAVISIVAVATLFALVALLIKRLTSPVLRLISNFDDYFSWLVTVAPLVTGLLAVADAGFGVRYETLLAIHLLSVWLLFAWLPFGKLGHAFLVFLSRGTTGALFARRGART
jgi:nitrate reductase gamma subunit